MSKLVALRKTSSMLLRTVYYLDHKLLPPSLLVIIQRLIIENEHWSKSQLRSIKYVEISENIQQSKKHFNSYIKIMQQGSPSCKESDSCLAELLLSSNRCSISTFCRNIMDEYQTSKGYHMTHKLLYYIIVRNKGCTNLFTKPFHTFARHFCQEIYNEISTYLTKPLDFRLRDIFLEQALLCGYLGHSEFLIKDWMETILKWQDPDGQFRHFGDEFDSHINGLAVAFLTVVGQSVLM